MSGHGSDAALRQAVRAASRRPGALRTFFQPIVDLERGTTTGYEALARFVGPPSAPPDRWFAAAREEGIGAELEARALRAALDARRTLPGDCFLAVNVSPGALLSDQVAEVFGDAGDLRGVVVEVTEQTRVADHSAVAERLTAPRLAGAIVAIDDAGAGFASLERIVALEPEMIKVDRGLVRGLDTDPTKAAVVETLGIFASRVDAWLLAEGIETPDELERVLTLGVPLGQGFWLGHPHPAMRPGDAEAREACRRRTSRADEDGLARLAEPVPVLPARATGEAIGETLAANPGAGWIALVDEHERPTCLIARARPGCPPARVAALSAMVGERLTDIARRMLTRPDGDRLAPVALCDESARLIGLVRIEEILSSLAEAIDGGAADDDGTDPARHGAAATERASR